MTKGLTLPEWIGVSRKMIKDQRGIYQDSRCMREWLSGWEACLTALESDMKSGLVQGVV